MRAPKWIRTRASLVHPAGLVACVERYARDDWAWVLFLSIEGHPTAKAPRIDQGQSNFGSVLLPAMASEEQVGRALVAVGIFAPRGLDTLEWVDDEAGTIFDGNGYPIVYLTVFDRRLAKDGKSK